MVAAQKVVGTLKVVPARPEPTYGDSFQFREDYPDAVVRMVVRSIDVSTVSGKRDIQPRVRCADVGGYARDVREPGSPEYGGRLDRASGLAFRSRTR